MLKHALAQYLVNLHTLLLAQTSSVHNASTVLAEEYDRVWAQLKEEITNETGNRNESPGRSEAGTDQQSGRRV